MISIRQKIFAAGVCCLCSVFCAQAAPRPRHAQQEIARAQTAQLQSVSGHISSVEGNKFALETTESQSSADQEQEEKVMTFTVDQNTTVQGKIEVGSTADVTYRTADGNNIAVSIRVTPQS
jgi:hypothetical protein